LFVTLWEFEVKPGSEELFERTYGRDGQWAMLFRKGARYRGTRLLRDVGGGAGLCDDGFVGISGGLRGVSGEVCEEYGELDRECEGMMAREKHLSEYENK
jgi:hypothetical protein